MTINQASKRVTRSKVNLFTSVALCRQLCKPLQLDFKSGKDIQR